MNLEYKSLLPAGFSPDSRVWIYQSNRMFTLAEVLEAEKILNDFTAQWKAHGADVKGFATVFFGQFIVMMADESHTEVSGCSTDSSVRVIKEIEKLFNINLFDRQLLAFAQKDKIQVLPLNQVAYAIENSFISFDTLYFNNTVLNKKDLEENWIIPAGHSWLSRKFNFTSPAAISK